MLIRHARRADAEVIARLHAESWRSTYRGIFADEFLDGPVFGERLSAWRERLSMDAPETRLVLLAGETEAPLGFICVLLDADRAYGSQVDNLHVLPEAQGRGLGRRLMACAARWVSERRPSSPMHLWVFEGNTGARAFYERLGGLVIQWRTKDTPDGRRQRALRYSWSEPKSLAALDPDGKCPG
jgi:GNAT superfamily N-acetyltransferase